MESTTQTQNAQSPPTETSFLAKHDTPSKPRQLTATSYGIFAACGAFVGLGAWLTHSFTFKTINRGIGKGITLPYIPATPAQIQNVTKALTYKNAIHAPRYTNVLDIGSGNGEICIEVAKKLNYDKILGIEINRPLVFWSAYRARRAGVSAQFRTQDLWKYNLGHLDNVIIFGVDTMMPRLSTKFTEELSSGTRIVVCRFPLEDRTPIAEFGEGVDTVWLYFQE